MQRNFIRARGSVQLSVARAIFQARQRGDTTAHSWTPKNEGNVMINSLVLVGRAGRDPEMRYFESGRVKTTFSMAVNRPTKEKETDWFDIEIWGRQAEIAGEYVRKGSLIGIEGRLDFNRWTDDSGNKNIKPVIAATALRLLGSKKDSGGGDMGGGGDFSG